MSLHTLSFYTEQERISSVICMHCAILTVYFDILSVMSDRTTARRLKFEKDTIPQMFFNNKELQPIASLSKPHTSTLVLQDACVCLLFVY